MNNVLTKPGWFTLTMGIALAFTSILMAVNYTKAQIKEQLKNQFSGKTSIIKDIIFVSLLISGSGSLFAQDHVGVSTNLTLK